MSDQHDDGDPDHRPIITRRLILKTPTEDERDRAIGLAADPVVARNLAAAPGDYWRSGGRTLAVVSRSVRSTIGISGYGPMSDRPDAIEVATWIGEAFWGRGYATEATQAVVDLAFADTGATAVWCSNRVSNSRARRVIEKCGFQFRETGMVRSPVSLGAIPVERYVLERRNWASLKSWASGTGEESDVARDSRC
ncbi:MAG: GNAT family N-acetyltransferase [Bauldia sp.]|uniref:GNAT family N-acetyltransferase n=1 Tax=Bauldia sp. TaxID=2575872 RepID=UPI001DB287C8|nr:GNAT family N-acetyltransferase [Bauldia sp.]MCB1496232.1 GNAT family N-acetyltransferase [Bauldia sp.]